MFTFCYKGLFSPVLISSMQMLQHSLPCRILPREREPGWTQSPFVQFEVSCTWVLRQASPAPNNKETNTRISILTIVTEGIEQFLPVVPDILPWCQESLLFCIPKWRRVREEKETTKESKRVCKESWKGCKRWYQDQHLNLFQRFDNDRQVVLIMIDNLKANYIPLPNLRRCILRHHVPLLASLVITLWQMAKKKRKMFKPMQTTGPRPTLLTKALKTMSAPLLSIEPTGTITLQRPITWSYLGQKWFYTMFTIFLLLATTSTTTASYYSPSSC